VRLSVSFKRFLKTDRLCGDENGGQPSHVANKAQRHLKVQSPVVRRKGHNQELVLFCSVFSPFFFPFPSFFCPCFLLFSNFSSLFAAFTFAAKVPP